MISVEGEAALQKLAVAYKAGGKQVQRKVRAGLGAAAKPLASEVANQGGDKMPHRGGLAAQVMGSRASVRAGLGFATPMVEIVLKSPEGYSLKAMNQGSLRHPVFGHRSTWVDQSVPADSFTDAFDQGAPRVYLEVRAAIEEALLLIAREASNV